MWPLSLILLFASAAPPQHEVNPQLQDQVFRVARERALKLAQHAERRLDQRFTPQQILDYERSNTCYTVRSYMFRRQDGQAPVLAGTTTCTPANKLQQRQVKPQPGGLFVPLGLQLSEQPPD